MILLLLYSSGVRLTDIPIDKISELVAAKLGNTDIENTHENDSMLDKFIYIQ
jgi:hypothetical protein